MSDDAEQQSEEIEVLKSIYEGDDNFKQVNDTTYHYTYTEGDKSFIVEIIWGPTYPTEKPTMNLDIFYNQHLIPAVKAKILSLLDKEADQWIGCAMTYTLFECLKDKLVEIFEAQVEEVVVAKVEKIAITDETDPSTKKQADKKEQMTKAQKRRAWDRAEAGQGGAKARGWDWVDIVKHLSQAPHVQPAS